MTIDYDWLLIVLDKLTIRNTDYWINEWRLATNEIRNREKNRGAERRRPAETKFQFSTRRAIQCYQLAIHKKYLCHADLQALPTLTLTVLPLVWEKLTDTSKCCLIWKLVRPIRILFVFLWKKNTFFPFV